MAGVAEQHVFIVDDEPKVLRAVSETLGSLGVQITCFSSASACLEHLISQKCDLLITDLKMPEMDGIELLKRAKQLIPWLPVLVVTGYGNVNVAVKAMKFGAVDFLEKPLVKGDFLRRVKAMLQQSGSASAHINASLNDREIELLNLILDGKTNKEMGTLLNCSQRTVEVRRAHLMERCGVKSAFGLVRRAAAMGLVELPAKRTRSDIDSHEDANARQ